MHNAVYVEQTKGKSIIIECDQNDQYLIGNRFLFDSDMPSLNLSSKVLKFKTAFQNCDRILRTIFALLGFLPI